MVAKVKPLGRINQIFIVLHAKPMQIIEHIASSSLDDAANTVLRKHPRIAKHYIIQITTYLSFVTWSPR